MKKLNFKVAITSADHLRKVQSAAFVAGCNWPEGKCFRDFQSYIECTEGLMIGSTQSSFEQSKLPLLHSAAQIEQLGKMPSSNRFQEGDPIYLVDLLRSPCVSEGFYDGGYEEADYYNLVYPRNSEGFFSAVEKAKQLLDLALIPF